MTLTGYDKDMKAIITSGCSLSEPNHTGTWPKHLKDAYNPEYIILSGQGSIGTDLISRKAIYYCNKALKLYKAEEILCVVEFTTLHRASGLFNAQDPLPTKLRNHKNYIEDYDRSPTWNQQGCYFDSSTSEDTGWYFWNLWRDHDDFAYYFTYYQSFINLLEQYLFNMLAVKNFCDAKGIKFVFMFAEGDIPKNLFNNREHWALNHMFDEIFNNNPYYLNEPISTWVKQNLGDSYMEDELHPTCEGHKIYTEKVLIPHLEKNGI